MADEQLQDAVAIYSAAARDEFFDCMASDENKGEEKSLDKAFPFMVQLLLLDGLFTGEQLIELVKKRLSEPGGDDAVH